MTQQKKRITTVIPKTQFKAIEKLIEEGSALSCSDFVREAINFRLEALENRKRI